MVTDPAYYTRDQVAHPSFRRALHEVDERLDILWNARRARFDIGIRPKTAGGKFVLLRPVETDDGVYRSPDERDIAALHEMDTHRNGGHHKHAAQVLREQIAAEEKEEAWLDYENEAFALEVAQYIMSRPERKRIF